MKDTIVLAYSGGLDTSVALRWLADEQPEVVERADALLSCGSWVFSQLTGERVLEASDAANPFLDADACHRLLERGVRTICIDAINLDETPDDEHPGETAATPTAAAATASCKNPRRFHPFIA